MVTVLIIIIFIINLLLLLFITILQFFITPIIKMLLPSLSKIIVWT